MAKYHFSAKFSDSDLAYHGEFETVLKTEADILKKAKIEFKKKCETWNKIPEIVFRFEIYKFTGNEEETLFEFNA